MLNFPNTDDKQHYAELPPYWWQATLLWTAPILMTSNTSLNCPDTDETSNATLNRTDTDDKQHYAELPRYWRDKQHYAELPRYWWQATLHWTAPILTISNTTLNCPNTDDKQYYTELPHYWQQVILHWIAPLLTTSNTTLKCPNTDDKQYYTELPQHWQQAILHWIAPILTTWWPQFSDWNLVLLAGTTGKTGHVYTQYDMPSMQCSTCIKLTAILNGTRPVIGFKCTGFMDVCYLKLKYL